MIRWFQVEKQARAPNVKCIYRREQNYSRKKKKTTSVSGLVTFFFRESGRNFMTDYEIYYKKSEVEFT